MLSTKIQLPDLPYEYDALEPVISKEIMTLHHDKHHAGYVNKAIAGIGSLETARNTGEDVNQKNILKGISFNLNGHLLHELFWNNMRKPNDNNKPSDAFVETLSKYFGSYDRFVSEFSAAAIAVEGSGWCVLAKNTEGDLLVMQVENHNKLFPTGFTPILTIDVWEHAYYLDYKNDRGAYVGNWWKVVNWDYVEGLYQA